MTITEFIDEVVKAAVVDWLLWQAPETHSGRLIYSDGSTVYRYRALGKNSPGSGGRPYLDLSIYRGDGGPLVTRLLPLSKLMEIEREMHPLVFVKQSCGCEHEGGV